MRGRAVGEACGFGGRRWLSGQKRGDAIELPMPKLIPSMVGFDPPCISEHTTHNNNSTEANQVLQA